MIVNTFFNECLIVLMTCKNESDGLTLLGALMAKEEFEKAHPPEGIDPEIESGVICPDCNGRHGYCVVFRSLKPRKYWRF